MNPEAFERNLVFVIPFACPGSGKSFVWNVVQQHLSSLPDWSYQYISSDSIRGELIKQTMERD